MQGETPFEDEYDKPFCKYLMFSAQVDHEGDRYGFPRNLQSAQDEVNQRRSKGLHELNNRRIIATKAAVADGNVEALRREAARSDGIVLVNTIICKTSRSMTLPSRPRSWANSNSCATPRRRSRISAPILRWRVVAKVPG